MKLGFVEVGTAPHDNDGRLVGGDLPEASKGNNRTRPDLAPNQLGLGSTSGRNSRDPRATGSRGARKESSPRTRSCRRAAARAHRRANRGTADGARGRPRSADTGSRKHHCRRSAQRIEETRAESRIGGLEEHREKRREAGPGRLKSSSRDGDSAKGRGGRASGRGLPLASRRSAAGGARGATLEHVKTSSNGLEGGQDVGALTPPAARDVRTEGTADERVKQTRATTRRGVARRTTHAAAASRGTPAAGKPAPRGADKRATSGAEAPAAAPTCGKRSETGRRQSRAAKNPTRRRRETLRARDLRAVGTARGGETMHRARRARRRPSAEHAEKTAKSTSAKNHAEDEQGRKRPHQRAPARGRIAGGRQGDRNADGSRPARPKMARANGSTASGENRPEAPCQDRPRDPAPSEDGATAFAPPAADAGWPSVAGGPTSARGAAGLEACVAWRSLLNETGFVLPPHARRSDRERHRRSSPDEEGD
jgi:hypothetical protein